MKIDRIELFHVAMPLTKPWRTAYGADKDRHTVLCHIGSGSVDAWSEVTPLAAPCYSPEWGGGVFEVCKKWIAPLILGKSFESGAELQQALCFFKGNQFAKALFDNAWWILQSKIENKPLHQLLGATRTVVPVGADFGVGEDVDDLLADIGQAVDDKFPRIKLKFAPGWGINMLKKVRKEFPETTIHIDCNSGYRFVDFDLFKKIDQFNLAMIEQPLQHDDLIDHAELAKQIKTPICLDESITSPLRAAQAIAQQSCGYINIKPGRVGGLTNALTIHNLCKGANIPCWVGGMLESAIGSSLCIALAMLDNFTYPADIFPSDWFYPDDLADPPIALTTLINGVPSIEALDHHPEPIPERLEKWTLQKAKIG